MQYSSCERNGNLFSLHKFDSSVLEWIQKHMKTRVMDRVMLLSTRLGDWGAVWILYFLMMMTVRDMRHTAMALLFCVLACAVVGNFAIKPLFRRTRPCNMPWSRIRSPKYPSDSSFPSCHALTSVAAAVTICHAGGVLGISSVVVASLISFSRMYLYVHYPSDVIIGAIMGIAAGKIFLL
jgi:undecaprenyl-diphosphatase